MAKKFISTAEAAKILGVSTVAVFKKIKNGTLPAERVGRSYVIDSAYLGLRGGKVREKTEEQISKAVKRVVKEYGMALKKLGRE